MAASGLTGDVRDNSHVVAVAKFAVKLMDHIEIINQNSFNNFKLRIGEQRLRPSTHGGVF